jgi:hypothetical protein
MGTSFANATTSTTCACCGGTLAAAGLQCRNRGGTATLCGYSEYTSASTPPKKYRIKTLSGTTVGDVWTDTTCDTFGCQSVDTFSGTCYYNSSNCTLTENGRRVRTGSCPNENVATCAIGVFISGGDTEVLTQTTRTILNSLNCIPDVSTSFSRPSNPTAAETLSDEDTDQDAIDRLLAGAGGTWSAWFDAGGTGCTGVPPPCCLARWEERTTGFSFTYQESQYRVTASGLNPSTSYTARVEIYRRTFGSGTYTLFQTLTVNGTTDGSGDFSEDGDVPNEEGFESYAHAAYIIIPFP